MNSVNKQQLLSLEPEQLELHFPLSNITAEWLEEYVNHHTLKAKEELMEVVAEDIERLLMLTLTKITSSTYVKVIDLKASVSEELRYIHHNKLSDYLRQPTIDIERLADLVHTLAGQ